MPERVDGPDDLVAQLRERAKELTCVYHIEEILRDHQELPDEAYLQIVDSIPPAWEFPSICSARISIDDKVFRSTGFAESVSMITAPISKHGEEVGEIAVAYESGGPSTPRHFLPEEEQLLQTIARRISEALEHQELRRLVEELEHFRTGNKVAVAAGAHRWQTVVELLQRTDQKLYARMVRKMLTYLGWHEIPGAAQLVADYGSFLEGVPTDAGENVPQPFSIAPDVTEHGTRVFGLAEKHLARGTIYNLLQRWIQEDKASFIYRTLVNLDHSLADVAEAVRRFVDLNPPDGLRVSDATAKGVQVLLVRRMITNQLEYIRAARRFLTIRDFYELINHMIIPSKSHGVIGGKAAGLLLASSIIRQCAPDHPRFARVNTPKTWHLPSDSLHYFMNYNDMEEMFEQKYKPIEEIRAEYPHIVRLFKHSRFPPEIVHGLSMALDDLGEVPIIVRSSSRLEDRFGSAFSGKYKSLFLTNQGTKQDRLAALLDAVAEVYSSLFGPDPIQYRKERDLLDVREEMGVIIQQVVGNRIGPYYLPTCAGIAFSSNEFRWSPRIERTDGLLRIVPGLGTRAVDRVSDDYPVLIAPGRPELRVNSTADEVVRYSPRRIDILNVEENRFETVEVDRFLRVYGEELPAVDRCVSIYRDGKLDRKSRLAINFERDDVVFTFEGLIGDTEFVGTIREILEVLEKELQSAVDVEFAYDGETLWLLQCRPQSKGADERPAPIPQNVSEGDIFFRGSRHISNGSVPDISHIVYVDARGYSGLSNEQEMRTVARAVGALNQVLPKRAFILVGPGRWGSRGDITQGVPVTYADISNTAMLVEVAVSGESYVPDLSFGTHFFQDLVESGIRYVPLYPDNESVFNTRFLRASHNELCDLLPDFATMDRVISVIDVAKVTAGKVLRVLLNADINQALAYLAPPRQTVNRDHPDELPVDTHHPEEFWRWRHEMAERISCSIDRDRFRVDALYIIGSVKNGNSGPASDIDLIIHHRADAEELTQMDMWLEGWSVALDELNYLRTGYRMGGLLDVHYVTDRDIAERTSFAAKIGAVTDPAELLPDAE